MFDQAGAKGLLLANLEVDGNLKMKFDGDSPAFPKGEEEVEDKKEGKGEEGDTGEIEKRKEEGEGEKKKKTLPPCIEAPVNYRFLS
ncbi:ccaat-box dna-binding subunit related protein, partial [Cystoisospora suis]